LTDAESNALLRYARSFLREHEVEPKKLEELDINARVMDVGDELLVVGCAAPLTRPPATLSRWERDLRWLNPSPAGRRCRGAADEGRAA
jgi:hypothetical protein